ncbi:hypothetical protein HMPREF1986_00557 [Oribacterium sp. oral taxon 078 str. F0263]|nr:hypothetical protein HMPREF1986_00557 [Oribacterium sp. oral taxon 078 str. F0263]
MILPIRRRNASGRAHSAWRSGHIIRGKDRWMMDGIMPASETERRGIGLQFEGERQIDILCPLQG